LFSVNWFCVAFASTASYLILIGQVLDITEKIFESKNWILGMGVFFQLSWCAGRFVLHMIICGSKEGNWQSVMLILALLLILIYFLLDQIIWNENLPHLNDGADQSDNRATLIQDFKNYPALQMNIIILSLTWLTLGFNHYGTMNAWKALNPEGMNLVLEHNLLSNALAILSKLCAIAISLVVGRSNLPLGVLQLCCSLAYFIMVSLENQQTEDVLLNLVDSMAKNSLTFVTHMTTFLETAAFGLIWVITPTMFPKRYRYLL